MLISIVEINSVGTICPWCHRCWCYTRVPSK